MGPHESGFNSNGWMRFDHEVQCTQQTYGRLGGEGKAKNDKQHQTLDDMYDRDLLETDRRETEIEALAKSKLKKAMAEAGLA
jgi:hypothetical protein